MLELWGQHLKRFQISSSTKYYIISVVNTFRRSVEFTSLFLILEEDFYELFRKDGSGVDAAVALAEEERSYLASVLLNKLLVYLQTFKCIDLWVQTLCVLLQKFGNIPCIISGVIYEIYTLYHSHQY